jgi:hypothetical protein
MLGRCGRLSPCGARHGARWAGWTVEIFGIALQDAEPAVGWVSYVDADKRAGLLAGDPGWASAGAGDKWEPSNAVDAWLIRVRRAESIGFVEARRLVGGPLREVAVRLGTSVGREDAERLLPGLTLLRNEIGRRGGRPQGRAKHDASAVDAWIMRWKRRTATRGWPRAKELAPGIRPRS